MGSNILNIPSWEEGVMTDPSFGIAIFYLDLNDFIQGVRHLYSQNNTLIKYSKEEHSPISSNPSDTIQLGSMDFYGDNNNSTGLVKDTSEGQIEEIYNKNSRGSWGMEIIKEILATDFEPKYKDAVKLKNLSVMWGYGDNLWLYKYFN